MFGVNVAALSAFGIYLCSKINVEIGSWSGVHLVISDMVMPRMGGTAFVQALRHHGWHMPILIMSGHPLNLDMDLLQAASVFRVLSKPLNPLMLNQVIAEVLSG